MIHSYQGYQIKPHPQHPSSLIVVTEGRGGKIPAVLEGLFTSRKIAEKQIDAYLETKPKKDIGDGKKPD